MFFSRVRHQLAILLAPFLIGLVPPQLYAQSSSDAAIPTQLPGRDAILMGTDWYPEQWPESRWGTDLQMMEDGHIQVARIAEFAWSSLEPLEHQYDFGWLDRAIRLAEKHHVAIVLGTPTATPPAWLTQKYPETLRVEQTGQVVIHGTRAHGSVTSAKYREFCRQIAQQLAERYGHDRNVVGWQIDNEFGYGLMSYNEEARRQFQDWLKDKYKIIDSLNEHWTTAYWSQRYDNWREIPIPSEGHNPGLMLEWKRFTTYAWTSYIQNQINVIRAQSDPRQFITGNLMGWAFGAFDHYIITRPLTFVAWDDYVGHGHLDPDANGISHDTERGLKRENFWVIETQPGNVNWSDVNNVLDKGEVRAMAWHDIGHGSDEVGYWQWRSALNGQEELHGTLVGPDGLPMPLLTEVDQTAKEFAETQSAFRGTRVVSEVALLNDYDSRWAIEAQKLTSKYSQFAILRSYYHALRKHSQSIDIVSPYAPLGSYKLVVAPDLNLIPKELANHLEEYVRGGGYLVTGPRSGQKDEYNALLPIRQPGYLAEALGGQVEQYYALESDVPVSGKLGSGEATVWAELLKTTSPDGEVLLRYGKSNGWLDGQPCVITRRYGRGQITYVGAPLSDSLMAPFAEWLSQVSGVQPVFGPVADGVEVNRRVGENSNVFVLINFNKEKQSVALPHPMRSLLDQKEVSGIELPQYGVVVLLDQRKR
ncbi:MAG TPA: beta-galactosidase [Candidatus Acidoferrum sp.]|nr:beta-galactosidase [Candidatus Acidoferrum sp.]